MATRSGGSRSSRSGRSTRSSRAGSGRSGSASARSGRSTKSARSGGTGRTKRAGTTQRRTTRRRTRARADKSVEAFRDALERSITLSRERLQEVVDDAVRRGRITRTDANQLVSSLVSRGRQQSDELVRDLERLLDQARREIESRALPARRRATEAAGRASRAARDAADAPLAQADRLRRRAGVSTGGAITAYDQLTASQVKSRLSDLNKAQLRKVRTQEKRGKARKSVLDDIERRLK